jgi:hypothetical protein
VAIRPERNCHVESVSLALSENSESAANEVAL